MRNNYHNSPAITVICSYSCNARYIHIAKCGSTAIRTALLRSDGIEPKNGYEAQVHPHFRDIPDGFKPGFLFTFVRHPIARLVSSWQEKLKTGRIAEFHKNCPLTKDATFNEWCEWIVSHPVPNQVDQHWKPMHFTLEYPPRKGPINFIGRLENVCQDWRIVQSHTGLVDLVPMNVSTPCECDDLRPDVLDRVIAFYKRDFDLLGYRPRQPSELADIIYLGDPA